jgi:glycosyltransferase involved in cell wall biosynthesis
MLAAAGLARAIGDRLGGVDILTPQGLIDVDGLESAAVRENTVPSAGRAVAHRLPSSVRSAVGDIRIWRQDRVMQKLAARSSNRRYRFVLQFHRRFQSAGIDAARRAGVAFVLRVEALEIREEASWGVRRNGYGRLAEKLGELRIMRRADLIASVSDVLDGQLEAVGVPRDRRVVIPNGVDIDAFSPGASDPELRRRHGLDGRFAIGWVGGFRPFHGLEMVPELGQRLRERYPRAILCFLGTGPLREQLIERTRGLEDTVRILPPVPHGDVPMWLRSFDACLLLGESEGFHYSPMKLYEYLACAKPVIAARVGQVEEVFPNGSDELLVRPGDLAGIVDRVLRLSSSPALCAQLGAEGRKLVSENASWDARVGTLLSELRVRGLIPESEGNEA